MVLNNESISSIIGSSPTIQNLYIKLLLKWSTSSKRVTYQLKLNSCKVLVFLAYPGEKNHSYLSLQIMTC
jgi:hypothetical protein